MWLLGAALQVQLPLLLAWRALLASGRSCTAILAPCQLDLAPSLPCNRRCQVWAVRENLVELALGMPALRLGHVSYYGLTALLVAAAYGISILVPSVYVSLNFHVWVC